MPSKPFYQDLEEYPDDGGINSDFSLLRQNNKRHDWKDQLLRKHVWVKVGLGAVLVTLFILAIVAITRPRAEVYDRQCLQPLGGGSVGEGGNFRPVPDKHCDQIIRQYLSPDGQYWDDVEIAAASGLAYFQNYTKFGNLKPTDVVVFDIDETSLSNVDNFLLSKPRTANGTSDLPPLQPMLALYQALYMQGFMVTFITGRGEMQRQTTVDNLFAAGFGQMCTRSQDKIVRSKEACWLQLDMRSIGDTRPASVYKPGKREELVDAGYTVAGNFGDQFSDLVGQAAALAAFKLPNPMYYIL